MAQYPIKLMKDESGQPFVPLTSIKAVVGEEYIQTALLAEQVSTGHFVITNDKITDSDILNKIVAVSFPDEITATTNSYLKINEENEYLIYDEDGTGPLLIKDFAHVICFLMRKEDRWQLVKTGAAATAAAGGHTIVDNDDNVMPQQKVLQFKGFGVNDNPGTGATVISTPALVNNLSTAESGTGPLDAYQGKVLNDKVESKLPLNGGTITGHIYLNGITSSGLASTTKIIFGDDTTNYTNIYSSTSGLYIGNSLTDGSNNIGYDGANNTWRPASANKTASLGTSGIPWDKIYANTINGYTLKNACSKTTRSASAVTHSQWNSVDVDSQYVPDMSFIAYWNGAYSSGNNSNLQYCDRGRFGSIVTKGSGDYIATTGGTLSSGSIKKAGGSYSWNTIRESNESAPISITSYTGYQPAIKQKTPSGVYGIGCYTSNVHITYFADGTTHNDPTYLLNMSYDGKGISAGGANLPHVWVQSGTPSAKQTGDIWFVT